MTHKLQYMGPSTPVKLEARFRGQIILGLYSWPQDRRHSKPWLLTHALAHILQYMGSLTPLEIVFEDKLIGNSVRRGFGAVLMATR